MDWNELSEKEKVRLLCEQVMGCFVIEEEVEGYHMPKMLRESHAPPGFHWPIAYWNTDAELWTINDGSWFLFNPLHDLNDAWKIVEKMKAPDTSPPGWEGHHTLFATFCGKLEEMLWDTPTGPLFYVLWNLTPEAICQAALQAVEESKEALP